MRVIAADNMPGEEFLVDPDHAVIYFDAQAPIDDQRRYLATALGVLLADPADQRRYRDAALGVTGADVDSGLSLPRPQLRLVRDVEVGIPQQRERSRTPERVRG